MHGGINKEMRKTTTNTAPRVKHNNKFRLDFLNTDQRLAWAAYQQHDVIFLIGPAGTGKTYLSMAFAIYDILQRNKGRSRIILTRPIVEAGESLGYLPGDFEEKVNPYMMPLFDAMSKLVGGDERQKELVGLSVEIAPLAYLRGRSFDDAICIFDEAQNATTAQLKLYLSRLGQNAKIIVTGDPQQSDLKESGLINVVDRVETVPGIGVVRFKKESIVRHPLVAAILEALEK